MASVSVRKKFFGHLTTDCLARSTFKIWTTVQSRWSCSKPTGRNLFYDRVLLGQGPVFGVAALAPPRKSSTASGNAGHCGVYLCATADAKMAVVEGSVATELPRPAGVGANGTGYLGLGFDPSSKLAVTGSFDGTARVWRINWEELGDLQALPVRRLKGILQDRGVPTQGCFEKGDLITRIRSSGAMPLAEDLGTLPGHFGTIPSTAVVGDLAATACQGNSTLSIFKLCQPPPEEGQGGGAASQARRKDDSHVSPSSAARARALAWREQQRNHTLLARVESHIEGIDSVALQPAANAVVSGGKDGAVRVWDLKASHSGSTLVQSVSYELDLQHEFQGCGAWVWAVAAGDTHHPGHNGWVQEFTAAQPPVIREVLAATAGGVFYCMDTRAGGGPVVGLPITGGMPIGGMCAMLSHNRVLLGGFDGRVHLLDARKWSVVSTADTGAAQAAPTAATAAPAGGKCRPHGREVTPFWSGSVPPSFVGEDRAAAAASASAALSPDQLKYTFEEMYTVATASERVARVAVLPGGGATGCFNGSLHTWSFVDDLW